jgi:hypothetical protein
MNISHKLFSVGVIPTLGQHVNVVKRVRFGIEWEDGGVRSMAFVESILDTSSITDFRPLESLTKDDLIAWGINTQGGQGFVDALAEYHIQQIAYQKEQLGVVDYKEHFEFDGQQQVAGAPFTPIFPTPTSGSIGTTVFE